MLNVSLLLKLSTHQSQCIQVHQAKSSYDICTFPQQYCDPRSGICKPCIDECGKEQIPLACNALCKGEAIVKNLTAAAAERAIDPTDPTEIITILAVSLIFMTILLVITIILLVLGKQHYGKALANKPRYHAQETMKDSQLGTDETTLEQGAFLDNDTSIDTSDNTSSNSTSALT